VTRWSNVVDRIGDSFTLRLQAVLALHGESLNGHRDVLRALGSGFETPDQIADDRKSHALQQVSTTEDQRGNR
jgi:hypothetical protein